MYKAILITAISLVFLSSCSGEYKQQTPSVHRGIYHWKTTYNPTEWEKQWMKRHRVDRLYVKLFEVDAGSKHGYDEWRIVPVATTRFDQPLPKDVEVVPVVYITVDAIREMEKNNQWEIRYDLYADLLVERITQMMRQNGNPQFREVQLDCDWTEQTREPYFRLCCKVKKRLHDGGKTLSGTLRLHQLREVEQLAEKYWDWTDTIPFDRSLLMCYNTGRLQDHRTKNSILDFDDVKPYLRQYHSDNLPRTDVAYPVYTWGVDFDDDGKFVRLVNSRQIVEEKCHNLRVEMGVPKEIKRTQSALPTLDTSHTVVLYHLDSLNLSRYSYEDIEAFYSR